MTQPYDPNLQPSQPGGYVPQPADPAYGQPPAPYGVQPGPAPGTWGPATGAYGAPLQPQTNGPALAGLICGIVGVLGALPLALLGGFVPGVAAAILGGIGLSKASKTGAPNKGFAVAALVLAGFAIIIIPAGWAVITVIAASS